MKKRNLYLLPLMAACLLFNCAKENKAISYKVNFIGSHCSIADADGDFFTTKEVDSNTEVTFYLIGEGIYELPINDDVSLTYTDNEEEFDGVYSYDESNGSITLTVNNNITISAKSVSLFPTKKIIYNGTSYDYEERYKYNDKKLLIEKAEGTYSDEKMYKYVYEYDNYDNLIKTTFVDINDQASLVDESTYTYDQKNRIIERITHTVLNDAYVKDVYSYESDLSDWDTRKVYHETEDSVAWDDNPVDIYTRTFNEDGLVKSVINENVNNGVNACFYTWNEYKCNTKVDAYKEETFAEREPELIWQYTLTKTFYKNMPDKISISRLSNVGLPKDETAIYEYDKYDRCIKEEQNKVIGGNVVYTYEYGAD